MAQVLSAFHLHPWSSTWCLLFDSTSPLSTSSSSSCLSPSSSSTSSCSLSSSTRRTWQTCAAPLQTRVRTLMTSSTLQHPKGGGRRVVGPRGVGAQTKKKLGPQALGPKGGGSKGGGPKAGERPKGVGPKVGAGKVGVRRVGRGPKFRVFFPLPLPFSLFFFLWGSSLGILVVPAFKNTTKIQREDPQREREKRTKMGAGGKKKKRAKCWSVRRRGVRRRKSKKQKKTFTKYTNIVQKSKKTSKTSKNNEK